MVFFQKCFIIAINPIFSYQFTQFPALFDSANIDIDFLENLSIQVKCES